MLCTWLVFDSRPMFIECTSRWQHWAVILNCCPTVLTVKRLAMCSTRGESLGTYITFASKMWIRQNPLWLWKPEEISPEIQKRGTSGPKIRHVNVSGQKCLKLKIENNGEFSFKFFGLVQKLLQFWKCLGYWEYNFTLLVTSLGFKVRVGYLTCITEI